MTALETREAPAPWGVALRLGRRDIRRFPLRAVLVVVMVTVATALMTLPAVVLARALTPATNLALSGSLMVAGPDRARHMIDPAGLVIFGLAAALAVIQAVLLIAPAFLIGVQRRVRELALLSSAGARPTDLRRVILVPALLCGVTGAILGSAGVCAAVILGIPVGSRAELASALLAAALAALVGIGVAIAPAWYPAVLAARLDPVRAITSAPAWSQPRTTPAWVPAAGVLSLAAGAGLAVLAVPQQSPAAIVGGVALAEVGLILLAAAGLGALERIRTVGAVTAFVLRDAARHRVRVLPAVTASLAVVAAVTAAISFQATGHAQQQAMNTSALPSDTGTQVTLVVAGIVAVLLVVWVTAALAAQEAQAELETLEILGASRGTRRRIVAAQAGLVAFAGTVCGIPAGLALGALVVEYQAHQVIYGGRSAPPFVIPWTVVLVLVVAVPLVVAGLAALTTRTEVRFTRYVSR